MEAIGNIKIRSREEIIAWFNRGKEIKERRMHEARQKWEERQRSKKVAAQSGFYDLEWIWIMNSLDIEAICLHSPYDVCYDTEGAILFRTDYGVEYSVTFDDDANPYYPAYWFNLSNMNNRTSPGDPKIPQTVICIIEEFFHKNPDILLYMCSTEGGQQAQRARLFLRWFNGAEQQKQYVVRSVDVRGENNRNEYVALIVQRSNPNLEEILAIFDQETTMFNELKP